MIGLLDFEDEGLDALELVTAHIRKHFPSTRRVQIESGPTDSGSGLHWAVMITLKSGHCVRATKRNLAPAVRHALMKMQAAVHQAPTREQSL